MKAYLVELEIAGDTAMWTRPDTGDCPVSYPVPTYSAVAGIFKSILWGPAVDIKPYKVAICRPLHYHNFMMNYGGPLRKPQSIKDNNAFQFMTTVLTDVCYKMYAYVYPSRTKVVFSEKAKKWDAGTTSPGHAYAEIFARRLKRGQWFSLPCLGWREFTPSYLGPIRDTTKPEVGISMVLPSMLRSTFGDGFGEKWNPVYDQNVEIKNGVLVFPVKGGASC